MSADDPAWWCDLHRAGVSRADPAELFDMTDSTQSVVHAPDFPGNLDWINTGGRHITLADLRGKILLLDFWTYG
jgi:hypothetical protein